MATAAVVGGADAIVTDNLKRHCCVEPSRDTGAARSFARVQPSGPQSIHVVPFAAKIDVGRTDVSHQEDFLSREDLTLNATVRSDTPRRSARWLSWDGRLYAPLSAGAPSHATGERGDLAA